MTGVGPVTVALATFKRPGPLANALNAIRSQVDEANRAGTASHEILVIDNDPRATGRDVAEKYGARYFVESTPGIAAARNRALDEAATSDVLIFLDDDEVVQPGWLDTITQRQRETGAAAVAGKVVTVFPAQLEPWIRDSGAFIRPVRVDGQPMNEAATNNLLLHLPTIRALGLRFDERFGLTGGSDSMFTRQLTARGGEIRWAEAAVVVEQEEENRFTKKWVLMRTFRFGNTSARVDLALAGSPRRRLIARARVVSRGAGRVFYGCARWIAGVVTRNSSHRAKGHRMVYRGLGMLAGVAGYAHNEYGRRRRASS
ncbi:hypothetical protein CVS47_00191 [Microbacterium lemovicicum]|uniref:Glycosyltransferase 2-like domain-containing protein n=2 Tax=Microbacterium lemovicicum TaxID=1072463 RepID=A0A3S9W6J0_9MICO|nr:glycosyltransferase family A protein [Microbacterium lemovicicum]AZS35599.1 hypothetical protein CVS47_00191 [Microbacterium lemovicicum]